MEEQNKNTNVIPVTSPLQIDSPDFFNKAKLFREDMYQRYKRISKENTPQVDGSGNKIIRERGDGLKYIIESYMRECLDKHFPGWSWEGQDITLLGAEWVIAKGHLIIIDEHLLLFGIIPPYRRFYGTDSVRIQYKRGATHIPDNIVDVGDNCKSANSSALKYAINRLTHIGDDIYDKRIEEDGAGSFEGVVLDKPEDSNAFSAWVSEHKIKWTEVMKILEVTEMTQVTNFADALKKIKEAKSMK